MGVDDCVLLLVGMNGCSRWLSIFVRSNDGFFRVFEVRELIILSLTPPIYFVLEVAHRRLRVTRGLRICAL